MLNLSLLDLKMAKKDEITCTGYESYMVEIERNLYEMNYREYI
jgi:hypothetical protein